MSSFIDYLMSAKERTSADAARLQSIGKQAAREFVEDGKPLNDTIGTLSKEAGLNLEQIKRVVEYANNETFIAKFAQPYDKNIEFPVADAALVASAVHQTCLPHEKTASLQHAVVLPRYRPGSELFPQYLEQPLEKVAHVVPSPERIMKNMRGFKDVLKNTESEREFLESDFLSKFAQLHRLVNQELAAGEPPWAVGAAVAMARPSEALYGIIAGELGKSMETASLAKVAQMGMEVPEDNAITGLVQDLEGVSQKLIASVDVVQRTQAAIDELLQFLRGTPETTPTNDLFAESGSAIDPLAAQQGVAPPAPAIMMPPQAPPMMPPQGPPQGQPPGPPQGPPGRQPPPRG